MRRLLLLIAPAAMLAAVAVPAATSAQSTTMIIGDNTPAWISQATNLGPASPSQTVELTVWLRLQHENQLDQQAAAVVTRGNSSYHKFQSASQVESTYAPTGGTVNGVTNWLQAKGFTIISTAANNYYIDVTGTVAQAEQAFNVQINSYSYQGQTYYANAADPSVDTTNGSNGQIAAVSGLDDASGYGPQFATKPVDTATSQSKTPATFQSPCGDPTGSFTINLAGGGKATIHGVLPCGYGAKALETAYGLNALCSYTTSSVSGLCGQGQTIVITDAYGSSSLQQDVNQYDQVNGLPPLTVGQNLTLVNEPGIVNNKPENKRNDPLGWQAEVTLDVENAHAIAPGANIVLITSPNNNAPLDEALNLAVVHHYGNVVDSSWSEPEIFLKAAELNRVERILETGTLEGMSFNFSSGDDGDYSTVLGTTTAGYPDSSNWATSVGGTSLFTDTSGNYLGESGWGTDIQRQYACTGVTTNSKGISTCTGGYQPVSVDLGFQYGAGGGPSQFVSAPPWQQAAGVSSTVRQQPDVSMEADPETGSVIWITDHSIGATQPVPEQYGGTSLSVQLFGALMTLVNQQRASMSKSPIGLIPPSLYSTSVYGTSALHDVNVTPSFAQGGLHYIGSASGSVYDVYFNKDTGLTTGPGWDNVTGVGTPNGQTFINAMANQ